MCFQGNSFFEFAFRLLTSLHGQLQVINRRNSENTRTTALVRVFCQLRPGLCRGASTARRSPGVERVQVVRDPRAGRLGGGLPLGTRFPPGVSVEVVPRET